MEHSMTLSDEGYDLEEQLATAERRYAEARALSHKSREEYYALEAQSHASANVLRQARMRREAVEARCKRLRQLIDDLEERLG